MTRRTIKPKPPAIDPPRGSLLTAIAVGAVVRVLSVAALGGLAWWLLPG